MTLSTQQAMPALSLEHLDSLALDNAFWQYSLALWKNKALQETLLQLQDEQGFRVNLLLFAMWLGVENKPIAAHLENINIMTKTWHEQVVSPLRKIRKCLPKHSLRTSLQQSELQAEQIEQALLYQLSNEFEISPEKNVIDTLITNLFASRLPETHLLLCIQACLPAYSNTEIQAYLSQQHCKL